jgi:transcriptional regulator of acetoin/glycerol metabolism
MPQSKCPDWLRAKIISRYNAGDALFEFAGFLIDELVELEILEVRIAYLPEEPTRETLELIKRWNRWKDLERMYITDLVRAAKGNLKAAAQVSGLSRATIHNKVEEYKLHSHVEGLRKEIK